MDENTMEMMDTEVNEAMDTTGYETEDCSGKGLPVVAIGVIAAGIGLGVVAAKKCKGKFNDWKIKSLEKKGYTVSEPPVTEVEAEVADSDEETEK